VSEASVFAIPDERLGEVPAAVVYSEDDAALNAEDLKAALAARIAPFKVPAAIWVETAPLPKLGTGKIDKMALRERYRPA
jgi:acyl-CoA synthetase (AMP-forming)/AMP-acid ligase II